jgi:methionyl-tRNA formyltransferase
MKIVYCAYGRAGVECLNELFLNFKIKKSQLLIFTHDKVENEDFINYLSEKNLSFSFDNVNNHITEIKQFNPNYLISVYYRYIVNKQVLDLVNGKAMNLHPSLLPSYRGSMSGVWAIINNESETGISFHYMNSSIDDGNIILQEKMVIERDDTAYSIYHKLVSLFVNNFIKAFTLLIDGYNGKEQIGDVSYYSRDLPFNGKLKINEVSFEEASQFVKALYFPPYKGAIFEIERHIYVEINSISDLQKIIKTS